jgi:hypothetical protein
MARGGVADHPRRRCRRHPQPTQLRLYPERHPPTRGAALPARRTAQRRAGTSVEADESQSANKAAVAMSKTRTTIVGAALVAALIWRANSQPSTVALHGAPSRDAPRVSARPLSPGIVGIELTARDSADAASTLTAVTPGTDGTIVVTGYGEHRVPWSPTDRQFLVGAWGQALCPIGALAAARCWRICARLDGWVRQHEALRWTMAGGSSRPGARVMQRDL